MAHMQSLPAQQSHGSLRGYVGGFLLSVILTAAAFGLVMRGALPAQTAIIALSILAFVQIVVHLVFFLHVDMSAGQRWNVMALGYTALAALFLIGGTVWVMHNVSMNMMSR
ncbi:cytochrome o ubiquinol oxidase subunit IV [Paraburkholderia sp. MPAMCS5]|uniref:cytochrome o ubiquinol oxidase subunit IV n=1 Tax=Paraburkholderia sp. MPAMCS5 TaxID=3112563 RepID=UPI002E17935E|nr:cytochrome o ubiquinol oxidase subunit IV [Paraburkholderia sp. MPAMCS5]